jgi:surface protein
VSPIADTTNMFMDADEFLYTYGTTIVNDRLPSWGPTAPRQQQPRRTNAPATLMPNIVDSNIMNLVESYINGNPNRYPPIKSWDVSRVTNMSRLFLNKNSFNEQLNDWDVSNITDMSYMFSGASSFNQPLNNWNVEKVSNMSNMFSGASSFNQPLNDWTVLKETNTTDMFMNADAFLNTYGNDIINDRMKDWDNDSTNATGSSNLPPITDENIHELVRDYINNNPNKYPNINNWDVSNVTDMTRLFKNAESFNEALNKWNVRNVKKIPEMFAGCKQFNKPLDNWDTSNVNDMRGVFAETEIFNQPLDKWNVSKVTNMTAMFHKSKAFNSPINNWNVSNVRNMNAMFYVSKFNQPLYKWNTSNVNDMEGMFAFCEFNHPIESWNVSNVTNMEAMFSEAVNFDQSLNDWKVDNVTNMYGMFSGAIKFNQPLYKWNVRPQVNTRLMFNKCDNYVKKFKNDMYLTYRYKEWDVEKEAIIQPPEGLVYAECLLCSNTLNNVDGPGKNSACNEFCNDVVEVCVNHHRVHRGCILNSCNPPRVDIASQMGMPEYSALRTQKRRNNCPICQQPLITECDNFKSRNVVPRVPTEQLFEKIQSGGKRKKKRRTRNKRKKGNKRTKRTNKNN